MSVRLWSSRVNEVTGYRLDNQSLILGKTPFIDQLRSHSVFYPVDNGESFQWPECEADHSHPFDAKFKIAWTFNLNSSICRYSMLFRYSGFTLPKG
jgi:hypothetical protein